MLPAAAIQRIRREVLAQRPNLTISRRDGRELRSRFIDRFECPLGPMWMVSMPRTDGCEPLFEAEEPVVGHIRLGARVMRFEGQVVLPEAVLDRGQSRRVVVLAEPVVFREVQRRRWARVADAEGLVTEASLSFEASRVISTPEFELRRTMETVPVTMLDIGGGGVGILANDALQHRLRPGSLVRMNLALRDDEAFGFSASVRNGIPWENGIRYGLAFHGDERICAEFSARALHLVFRLQSGPVD